MENYNSEIRLLEKEIKELEKANTKLEFTNTTLKANVDRVKKEKNGYQGLFWSVLIIGCISFFFQLMTLETWKTSHASFKKTVKPMIVDAWECKGHNKETIEMMLSELFD